MSLIDNIDGETSKLFLDDFFRKYFESGFGSLSKHEIDLLVYHLLDKYTELPKKKSVYEITSDLMLTERKLKNIQIESYLKYGQKTPKENLKKICAKIESNEIKPELDGDKIRFFIDSPILKRDFEYAITSMGHIVDYSFNKNILSLRLSSFFEVINNERRKEGEKLKAEIFNYFREQNKTSKEIEVTLENKSWWKDQLKKLGSTAKIEAAKCMATSVVSYFIESLR